jgi:hypothetical protein
MDIAMRSDSRLARPAREPGTPAPEALLREAIEGGWLTVLQGSVVQVLHAAAKLQDLGSADELDRVDEESEFELDDELPSATLEPEIPSATPRGPARFGELLLGRPVRSYRDVADLCLCLGLLSRDDDTWRVHAPLPLPTEILPLEAGERDFHDQRQWRAQLPPTTRAMIQTFLQAARGSHPQLPFDLGPGQRLSCTASLYWWCQRTDAHPEAVRGAARVLVADHRFTAAPAPELLYWDEPFSLAVDEDEFLRTRQPIEAASHRSPAESS